MREAMRGLTTRGRSFLAAAAASGISAFILGERDLLRVAVLLAALPLLAAAYVGPQPVQAGLHPVAGARAARRSAPAPG